MVWTCPMRRSGPGVTGSGRSTRTSCAVVVRGRATNGTWMRCSSRSTAHSGTCGARSTSTATCSTFWSSRAENAVAAKKFFRRLLTGLRYVPRVIVTDKLLPGGAPRARAVGAASPVEVPEQPGRELASTDPATRAGDETLQISPACATVPVAVQRHLAALSAPSASAVGHRMATRDGRPLHRLEPDHRGGHDRRLNVTWDSAFRQNLRKTRER